MDAPHDISRSEAKPVKLGQRPLALLSAWQKYSGAIGVVALTTLLCLPLLGLVDLANIVLIFVLAVVAVASKAGRGPAVLASFLSVACFDFFFVPPRFSFTVDQAQYLITFVVMLAVSLVITHLTNAYRDKALEAEQRATEASLLHQLAASLSGATHVEDVARLSSTILPPALNIDCRLMLPDITNAPTLHDPLGKSIDIAEQMAAQMVVQRGLAVRGARYLSGEAQTDLLPLMGLTRCRGVIAIDLSEREARPPERFLDAIAALVCTAIERIHFVQVAQLSALDAESERLRSSLLAAISHDVRTPLTVIFGVADALAAEPGLPESARQKAEALRGHALGMNRMVENLLDMARLRSGRVILRRDWQAIPEIVGASVEALRPVLEGHVLQVEWPKDMPLMSLDAMLMDRVFSNLIENAAKYSPAGSLIRIHGTRSESKVRIDIDSQGSQFPAERLEKIFELFERGDQESGLPGAGLGLAICRAIVLAHGGSIDAANLADGARVRISLPLSESPAVPREEGQHE